MCNLGKQVNNYGKFFAGQPGVPINGNLHDVSACKHECVDKEQGALALSERKVSSDFAFYQFINSRSIILTKIVYVRKVCCN